jgi:hypothetical protein
MNANGPLGARADRRIAALKITRLILVARVEN